MSYKYYKDKRVKIFREIRTKDKYDPSTTVIREYQHPEGTLFNAYIRQLSDGEKFGLGGTLSDAGFMVVMNSRKIEIGFYIEYRGEAYRIEGIDVFEMDGTEMTLKLSAASKRPFDEIRYKEL